MKKKIPTITGALIILFVAGVAGASVLLIAQEEKEQGLLEEDINDKKEEALGSEKKEEEKEEGDVLESDEMGQENGLDSQKQEATSKEKKDIEVTDKEMPYYCNTDSDCISVADGCCDCNHGGTAIAINKKYLDYWKEKMLEECDPEETICMTVISNHWTCFAEPKCVEGECQLVE